MMCSLSLVKAEQFPATVDGIIRLAPVAPANISVTGKFNLGLPDFPNTVQNGIVNMIFDSTTVGTASLEIQNISCNPVSWNYPIANRYEVSFDCGSLFGGSQNYTYKFNTSRQITNVEAKYKINYIPQSTPTITLSGTDYRTGDTGLIFLQLLQDNFPLYNRSCTIDVFYPNLTQFKNDVPLLQIQNSDALYYHQFTIPNETGVYPVSAVCNILTNISTELPDQFQLITGTSSGNITEVYTDDNNRHQVAEATIPPSAVFYYNFTNLTAPINLTVNLSFVNIFIYYLWDIFGTGTTPANENMILQVYSKASNRCENLTLLPPESPPGDNNFFIQYEAIDIVPFIQPEYGGTLRFCFQDEITGILDLQRDTFSLDFFQMQFLDNKSTGSVDTIRGSGELNVLTWVDPLFDTIDQIPNSTWNFTNRTLTAFSFAQNACFNGTVSFNGTVNITNTITINATFNVTANFTLSDFSSIVNNTFFGFCPQGNVGRCVYEYFWFSRALPKRNDII